MSMTTPRTVLARNQLSVWERVSMFLVFLPAPYIVSSLAILIAWELLQSPFSADGRAKTWKRVALDRASYRALYNMNRRQIRAFFGETGAAYDAHIKASNTKPVIEEVGEGARLLWVGPKSTERVLLYVHGGAFLWGMFACAPRFLEYLQAELRKSGKPTGAAIINYTLVPDGTFPTQLKQTVLAIQQLIKSGVKPENIQLVGDSAGGNLIHQVISHLIHPVEGVPVLNLSSPLAGAYFMSPWIILTEDPILHTNEGRGDVLGARMAVYWGSKVLRYLPESSIPYVNPHLAPDDWLDGVEGVVSRVLITAGEAELLRDSIIRYSKVFERHHNDVMLFVEDHAVHDDILLKLLAGDQDLGKLATVLVIWLERGFSQ